MYLLFMMIFPSTQLLTEKFHSFFVVRRAVKRIRETCSTCIPACLNAHVVATLSTVADLSLLFQLLKLRPEISLHIFRQTLSLLLTDRFSLRRICFTKVFVPQSMWGLPCPVWALVRR